MRVLRRILPHGQAVRFVHRDDMGKVRRARATLPSALPTTSLPVDCTGGATVSCPMDANDSEGDCGPVMAAHVNGIRTYGQGKPGFSELQAPVSKLVKQYLDLSGGDNGTTEDMLVGNMGGPDGTAAPGIWLTGIAGDSNATIEDHLDVDVTDVELTRYCHDWFYGVCVAWSVPDAFLQSWTSGSSWLSPMKPDPANGHFTPLSDVDSSGNYRMWTWGGWSWVSPAFLASVQPQAFVTFSHLQFNAQGFDSHGRHVSDVGAAWVAIGGNPSIVASVAKQFPVKPTPDPAPTPPPSPSPDSDPGVVSLPDTQPAPELPAEKT